MKKRTQIIAFFIVFLMAVPALGHYTSNLYLWKYNPYDYGPCGFCSQYFNSIENQDRFNFSDYQQANQAGYYHFNLTGHEGTLITLFGDTEYRTGQGYLIIRKNDDRDVQVKDLEQFAPNRWTEVRGTDSMGGYSAYYKPSENFKENVASLKWGKWWSEGQVPANR